MKFSVVRLAAFVLLGPWACSGQIEGDPSIDGTGGTPGTGGGSGMEPDPTRPTPPPPPSECTAKPAIRPGASPMRRLTRFEYDNTVRDLLGDTSQPARLFPPDEEALGFDNNAEARTVGSLLAEYYMNAAEQLAEGSLARLRTGYPCDTASVGESACGRRFVEAFGKRAWRRPLPAAEVDAMAAVFEAGRRGGDYNTGLQLVVRVMLQAPQFLYRVELGGTPLAGTAVVQLDAWQVASRLSYLLWGTMPDAALFAAAESGGLLNKGEIATQARRMLADKNARPMMDHFHDQWLALEEVDALDKDVKRFVGYGPDIGKLMKQETMTFVNAIVSADQGGLGALLTAPYSYMNAKLATFYGVPGPTGTAFAQTSPEPARRAGLLSQGSLMSIFSLADQSSPVERGKLVRLQLLCEVLPNPPADAVIVPPVVNPNLTTRDRWAQHSANPSCAGCHRMLDPIGLGFENYDAVGRWRDTEARKTIDARGEVVGTDVAGPFNGVPELAVKLARSEQVAGCVVRQWFRFGYGRGEGTDDACTTSALEQAFRASSQSVRSLLVALTQTDAFLYRTVATGGAP